MASEVLARITDDPRWDFAPDPHWQEASTEWQEFYQHWRTFDEDEVLKKESLPLHPEDIDLFVRESYHTLFNCVLKAARCPRRGVLITGQSGMGKTFFLWYSLIRLVTLRQVVLFADNDRLYLFYKEMVYSARVSSMPPLPVFRDDLIGLSAFIWTLIDTDLQDSGPEPFLVKRPCFPVHASPLNAVSFRAWTKQRPTRRMTLPLWNQTELWQGLTLQPKYSTFRTEMASYLPPSPEREPPDFPEHVYAHRLLCELWKDEVLDDYMDEGEDIEAKIAGVRDKELDYAIWLLLNDAIRKYGFAARDVYNAVLSIPDEILHDHECAIAWTMYASLSAMVQHFKEHRFLPDEDEQILAVSSACPPPFYTTTFSVDFKSPWIAERVMEEIAWVEPDRLGDVEQLFQSTTRSSS